MNDQLRLHDGARIVVVGAGPAGSFFAHHALQLARQHGWQPAITICDVKNFARQGPIGCNMCAGVISAPLAARLEQAGFLVPDERVQRRVEGYCLVTPTGTVKLDDPDGKSGIRTVFRGNGPRFAKAGGNISFDDCLLDHVKAEGIAMLPYPVHKITRAPDPREPLRVTLAGRGGAQELIADLVVVACGLNTALLEQLRALSFDYQAPKTRRAAQAELLVGKDWIERHLENRIVVLTLRDGPVTMAVLTPKAEHVTLTAMGERDIELDDLRALLRLPVMQSILPSNWARQERYCHCFPRLPVAGARHPFTDRLVVIGDASFSRYYKNGIESAFLTARLAAETAILRGVSARAFAKGYFEPASRLIVRDNFYGRLLFRLPQLVASSATMSEAQRRVLADSHPGYSARTFRRSLWSILTGDLSYRSIFLQLWHPRLLARLALVVAASYLATRSRPISREVRVA